METIIMLNTIPLSRLNNAEFEFFINGTVNNILNAGYLKLGIPKEIYDPFNANKVLFTDIVLQSRVSDLTAQIAELEAQCDALLHYFFAQVENGRHLPMEADRKAYNSLYNIIHIYHGIASLPQMQQISQTRGLVLDVSKEGNSDLIVQLKLTPIVQAIDNTNVLLAKLVFDRQEEHVKKKLPSGGTVRRELIKQYNIVMTLAFATSVNAPTTQTASFIEVQNALIDEVNARYNLRMGLLHYYKKKAEEEAEAGELPPDEFPGEE